jgi:tetratricopeptide (TPR) repeat protein
MAQASTWRDSFTLFQHAIEVNPLSFTAWYHLAYAQEAAGDVARAERSYRRAIALEPEYWEARQHLSTILFASGRADEAIAQAKESIAIRARLADGRRIDFADDQARLGDALRQLGRFDEAAAEYRAVLRTRPGHERARRGLRAAARAR